MADEEKPPTTAFEIAKIDTERRALTKALEAASGLASPLAEKMLAIEKLSGISGLTDKMLLFEENSSAKRIADSMRMLDENSTMRQVEKLMQLQEVHSAKALFERMQLFEDNPSFKRLTESMRLMDENSAFKRIAEGLNATGELARLARGPMWELRDAGMFGVATGRLELDSIRKAVEGIESHFRLPAFGETAQLAKLFSQNSISDIAARWAQQESSITSAIERMHTPWLDIHDKIGSIAGFAEMQGLGLALRNIQGFEDNLSATLRGSLGDWRDPITWRPEIFTDFEERSKFYDSLGFNPALTDFPLPAFEQSLDLAGLGQEPPPLIEHYGPPIPLEGEDDEAGLARTNAAHDWLQRLERLLRRFIDENMTRTFGADWPKHRLPNGFYDDWQDKKRKAREAGAEDLPLIAYADFTHYSQIICKTDNWREVFAPFFKRPESVRESFQRLYPIRLDTAHARLITLDDELLLYVEVKRFWAAIGMRRN